MKMLKSGIGLSLVASSLLAIDQGTVVDQLACETFTSNDALAGVYKYYNEEVKDWALYMPETNYLLVHETGESTLADGSEVIPTTDFSSIDSSGAIKLGNYTGTNIRVELLSNSTMRITDSQAGLYNHFDEENNLWFLYMPQNNYLLVHETGKTLVEDGALVIDVAENFDTIEATEAGSVHFIAKGGCVALQKEEISAVITESMTLTADKVWLLDGKVEVTNDAVLTIEPGTTVAGKTDTNGWLLVHPGAQLIAAGTAAAPITFTSEIAVDGGEEVFGQWPGITLVGNAGNDQTSPYEVDGTVPGTGNDTDSSGILKYLRIHNTGGNAVLGHENNALSLVGIGSGTTIDNITIHCAGDDGIELWGGTVNLTNITIDGAQDDSFDTDEGWSGTVDGLNITNGRRAGIEISGTSVATYKNIDITLDSEDSEGGIYFKSYIGENLYGQYIHEIVGGIFENVTVTYNSTTAGAINVKNDFDEINSSFTNVTLTGSNPNIVAKKSPDDDHETAEVQALFDAGSGNSVQ